MRARELTQVDVALVLAEVVCRLRHAGVPVAVDRAAMGEAHAAMGAVLSALGVPTPDCPLAEADYHLLRCAAART